MASIHIEAAPKGLSLLEAREALRAVAEELNRKRAVRRMMKFATVRVGELLMHPQTKTCSFIIQFSDGDRTALRYLRRERNRLEKLGKERLLRSERVDANWFTFVRFDPCMT